MDVFARELGFPEGPVVLPDGSFLFVEMSPDKGCITQISADGKSRQVLAKTGRPNGLARDRHGAIWIAETAQRALMRFTPSTQPEVVATSAADQQFLFLNDLAFAPNGELFLTDSGILHDDLAPNGQLVSNWRDLAYDGRVYRVDPLTRVAEILDRGLQFTNGVAFGPDRALYIAETLTGNIYRYDSRNGRIGGQRELFGNVIEHFKREELKGPDGMKFGADGNLYVCVFGQGDVTVLGRDGRVVRRIKTDGDRKSVV